MHYKKITKRKRVPYTRFIAALLATLLIAAVAVIANPGGPDGNQYQEVYTTVTLYSGQSLADAVPDNPLLDGYVFMHWSHAPGGLAFDFEQPLFADTTLYAIWLDHEQYTYNYESQYDYSYGDYNDYDYADIDANYQEAYLHYSDDASDGCCHYEDTNSFDDPLTLNEYAQESTQYLGEYDYQPDDYAYTQEQYYDHEYPYHYGEYIGEASHYYDEYHYYAYQTDVYRNTREHNNELLYADYNHYGYIGEAPNYYESDEYPYSEENNEYSYNETITITFLWNRGVMQITHANIELDYRGNVTVAEEIEYMVILDGNYIHIRFPIELEYTYVNLEDDTWTYEIHVQYEETEIHDEYGYFLYLETTYYTMVTVAHDILSRNSGFIGFTPFVFGLPGGFTLNVLASPFDTQAWLDAVGNNVAGNNVVVSIPQNVTIPGVVNISGNRHVIITSQDTNLNSSLTNHTAPPTTFSITHNGTAGRHFNVSSTAGANATLTISHVIIDGGVVFPNATPAARGGISVGTNAYFYMLPGSVIQHNRAVTGGGVHVSVNSAATRFTMLGGTIQNNVTTSTTAAANGGGGVHMAGSTFHMRHGDIINNRSLSNATNNNGGGGGVLLSGGVANLLTTVIMDDDPLTPGAGVRNITGNVASQGGGVHIAGVNSVLTINGNTNISNNTTIDTGAASGFGVRISGGQLIMNGGTISNNLRPAAATGGANGGGVHLSSVNSRFYLNNGTISGHTITTSGGGVHVSNGARFEMNDGTISGNNTTGTGAASGGGGVSVLGDTSRFYFNGGTIQNNHAGANGGGILLSEVTNMNPLPLPTGSYFHFPQLVVAPTAVFANNTAGNGSFTPPGNAAVSTQIAHTPSSGGYLHPLNNLDINFFFIESDWLKLDGLINTTTIQRIIIHPTSSAVTPGIAGTDYNLVIQDPGDGYTITTIVMPGGLGTSHSIEVPAGRTVTLTAAPGADIVLRMPVPNSPNTPSQAPWGTTSASLTRHFTNNGNLTIGGGVGFGTLTLDGNVRNLPDGNTGTRGGVVIGASGVLTVPIGGVIYDNRAGGGGGVLLSGANAILNLSGGSIINNGATGTIGVNGGGGVVLTGGGATFNMTSGTISGNTSVTNGGGVALTSLNTHFYMHGGTIDDNTANNVMQGGGGVFVSGTTSRVHFLGGTISNNHSGGNGGGIFATQFTMIDPIPLPTGAYFHYPQLIVSTSAIFSGNTSVGGGNTPPGNAATATQITNAAQRSGGFAHPLNNLDINFFFSSADWARLDRLITDPAGPDTIVIHPSGSGASGWSGTTYNLVITDPGGGSLITTISLQGAATPHNINVSRPITIAAAAGADIVIRMPVPGAPNTPNTTPWVTARDSVERHFVVGGSNLTLGGGAGFGTLTLDGNANQNTSNRGGIAVNANAQLIIQTGGVIYNNRATNGGAVSLEAGSSSLNLNGGSILNNFATNGGGVAFIGNGAQFTMSSGSVTGNVATELGGGVRVAAGAASLFTFAGGTISNNSAVNGGGIHVATFTNADPLPAGTHFPQVAVSSAANFTGNIAHAGGFQPPSNAATNTNISVTNQVSGGFPHPLNNLDINFFRVLGSDWRRINSAITGTTATSIVIHPTGTTGVTDGLVGSTYNLIISDPGNGSTITTVQLGEASPSHSITITGRTVAISAGSGGNIVIRMPAPGAPNTPNQAPWLSSTEVTGRHFIVRHNGHFTLHGGTGTLTLDGNSELTPITMNGVRGGVELGGGAGNVGNGGSFTLNTGGIIYNSRAIGNSYHTGGGGGVNVINAQNAVGGDYPSTLNFNMHGGYIIGNYARWRGGGVSLDSESGGRVNFTMTGGRIRDNWSSEVGGGISICCGVRTWLYSGYVHDNMARNGGGMFIGEFTAPYNHIAIHGGEIFNNTATYNGGGIHTGNLTGNRFTMTGGHIHTNYAVSVNPNHGNGGGIFHHAGRMFLFGGRINSNHASGSGGGLYSTDNAAQNQIGEFIMDVNRPTMRNLNTLGAGGINPPLPGQPVNVPNPNYPNGFLQINNNRARFNGGGASLMTRSEFDEFNIPFAICDLVQINNNTAGIYGGGLFLGNETRRVYMSGGTISGNGHPTQVYTNTGTSVNPIRTLVDIRTRNGGGLFMNDGMFTLYSGDITGNAALGHYTLDPSNNPIWNGGYGGGVHMGTNASTFIIADYVPFGGGAPVPGIINFADNTARVGGAVHYYHGTWSYTDNTGPVYFVGNTAAERGGALAITNNRTLNINHLWTFNANIAGQQGGAIYLSSSTLNMSGGLIGGIQGSIAGNQAVHGGGVYAGTGTTFNMTGGTIRLNIAIAGGGNVSTGGGVATHDGRTVFNMHGGLIQQNSATLGGGVGMMNGSTMNITPQGGGQPVITGNTADFGAGVHVYGIENRAAVPVANHGASTLTMNGGTIGTESPSMNTAHYSGGGIFVGASTMDVVGAGRQTRNTAILNAGSNVTWNRAHGVGSATVDRGGGGIYVTANGQLIATNANITNNSAPVGMGGGIFSEIHEYVNPLTLIAPGTPANLRAYRNLTLVGVNFSDNTSNALHNPPINANATSLPHIGFASTSPAAPHPGNDHPLNNHDINYVGVGLEHDFYFHKTDAAVDVTNPVLLPGAQFILVRFNGTGIPPVGMVTDAMIGNGPTQWTQVGGTRTSSSVATEPMTFTLIGYSYYHIIEILPPSGFQMPMGQWRARATNNGTTLTITNISDGAQMPSIWGPITMQNTQGENISVRMIGNTPNVMLPMSGGIGMITFIAAGSVIIALALSALGIVTIIKKRSKLV
ncbi:MAG: hypothetical protein FWC73_12155 [Defluviitaleaceae bacterium]|nr:hypothetical protein [Defluviitaleaceae bacterium]